MFHWIEMDDQLLCAESGAHFVKDDTKFIQHYRSASDYQDYVTLKYYTEAERDEAWTKLKADLGVK